MLIQKSDGTQEEFKPEKLEASLKRAGANEGEAKAIVQEIEGGLRSGMQTSVIYHHAFSILKSHQAGVAARYSLKRSLHALGPTGFPFEAYLAELFRKDGYEATTNIIARGRCVEHEIDVFLKQGEKKVYVEAKYHNTAGFRTDLKVALYVQARIEDIKAREGEGVSGMIVTNTKFSSMAETYATCVGLPIMSWEHPHGKGLHDLIDRTKLYPVTSLASLTNREKQALMAQKVVLCNGLMKHGETLKSLGIAEGRLKRLTEEVGALCTPDYGAV